MLLNPNDVSNYIDVSVAISEDIILWPGSSSVKFQKTLDLAKGDVATDTTVRFSVHTGTHVDAPSHFISGGKSVDQLPLDILIGEACVADIPENISAITADVLDTLLLCPRVERLLLRTKNSQSWLSCQQKFDPDFAALTADAAEWVVDHGIKLIGIDYLSIQRFDDGPETHRILLREEVLIIEGLNLSQVLPGIYELICLPIKIRGLEGAPARVLLRPKE